MKKVMVLCVLAVCLVSFNASAVIDETAIVAAWGFEAGDARDYTSGNGYDGSLYAGATIVDTERGNVVNLTGDNGVYVANTWTGGGYTETTWLDNLMAQSHTFMCWYKMDAWGAAWQPTLFAKGYYQLNQRGTTQTWRYEAEEITLARPQAIYTTPTGTEADGGWHHVAGVVDAENGLVQLYFDGVKMGESAILADLNLKNDNGFVGRFMTGQMDEVIWLDEALDEAGVQSWMPYHVTPEPATMLLLSVGGAALLRRRRA